MFSSRVWSVARLHSLNTGRDQEKLRTYCVSVHYEDLYNTDFIMNGSNTTKRCFVHNVVTTFQTTRRWWVPTKFNTIADNCKLLLFGGRPGCAINSGKVDNTVEYWRNVPVAEISLQMRDKRIPIVIIIITIRIILFYIYMYVY